MTYYVLLLSALAVAGLGALVVRWRPLAGQAIVAIGCAGCIGCIAWQVRQTMFPPTAREPDRGQAVVAYFLANQVLREVGDRQGAVLLFFPPETVFDEQTVGTYAGTFARVLRGFDSLRVQTLTLTVPAHDAKQGHFPLQAFQKASLGIPGPVAYVSFAGIPPDLEHFHGERPAAAPFYLFDPWGRTNWIAALKRGSVRAAVVPRPDGPRPKGGQLAGEPGELFESLYLMATPANAEEVAGKLARR